MGGCALVILCAAIVWLVTASAKPKSKASAAPNFIRELKTFGIKSKILTEITKSSHREERVVGSLDLHFKQTVIFTTHRIVSVCRLPGFGVSTEWEGMKIVLMGGNFQIPFSDLQGMALADSRIRTPHGGHGKTAKVIKAVGPSVAKAVYPYEIQLFGQNGKVVNRLYGITSGHAATMGELAAKAGLRFSRS